MHCLILAGFTFLAAMEALATDKGSISMPALVSSRLVQVAISPPTNAYWVKLSQDATFKESTNGIAVQIVSVDPDKGFADLNITYPGGVTNGQPASPAGFAPGQKEVKILVLPTRFSDGGQPPSFVSSNWLHRLMFSTNAGPDARGVANSARNWMEQNSYGQVLLTGDIYPGWVMVQTAEHYNSFEYSGDIDNAMVSDAIAAGLAGNPGFFSGKSYDFVVVLTPGDLYSVSSKPYSLTTYFWDDPNHLCHGYLIMDLPVEANSPYRSMIIDEHRFSSDETTVKTRLDVDRWVEGVWLATDPGHTGTNFFTSGSVAFHNRTITLGTPLPSTNTAVLVSYAPCSLYQIGDETAPLFSIDHSAVWYGAFLHELSHGLGPHISFVAGLNLLDLYQSPYELISSYGAMSGGNHNYPATSPSYNEPCHFDAYTKYRLGFLQPQALLYGEGVRNLRLFATEEFPYSARTKLVKVPLQPPPNPGRERFRAYDASGRDFRGEEYLLLEWRKAGAVAGIHNFDAALPDEGLLIYHVIEANSLAHGFDYENVVRVVDATPTWESHFPPVEGEHISLTTAATFGGASERLTYVHGENWQGVTGDSYPFLLHGTGVQTVYAKFKDPEGNESQPVSAVTTVLKTPAILITDAVVQEGNQGITNVSLNMSLSEPSAQVVTVAYDTTDGTATNGLDFIGTSGVAMFPPGTTNTSITIGIPGDYDIEPEKVFYLLLSYPTNAILARNQAVVSVRNDDFTPGQVDHFEWSPSPAILEAGQPAVLTLTARDGLNNLVTNFDGSVLLSGKILSTNNRNVKVLCFIGYAWQWNARDTAAISNRFTASQVVTTTNTDPTVLAGELAGKDVFLIPYQEDDYAANMPELGRVWSAMLNRFVRTGGTILVCTPGYRQQYAEFAVLPNAGLMAASWVGLEHSPELFAPLEHPLNEGLVAWYEDWMVATFRAPDSVVTLRSFGNGEAVVACKDLGAGRVVLVGYGLQRAIVQPIGSVVFIPGFLDVVIANAAKSAQNDEMFTTSVSVLPAGPLHFTNGVWSGEVTIPQAASNFRLLATDATGHSGSTASLNIVDAPCRIEAIDLNGEDVVLTFTSQTGRNYRLEYTDELGWGVWNIVKEMAGTGALMQVPHHGLVQAVPRFYRVNVFPQ